MKIKRKSLELPEAVKQSAEDLKFPIPAKSLLNIKGSIELVCEDEAQAAWAFAAIFQEVANLLTKCEQYHKVK